MKIISLLAILIAALVMTVSASAHSFRLHMCTARQPAKVELACAQRNIYHATFALIWVKREHSRTLQVVPVNATKILKLARFKTDMTWLLAESKRDKVEAQHRIYLASFPAHHNLWMCLHGTPALGTQVGHEASRWDNHNSGGNGHWGGLQMTPDWLGYFTGTADRFSQLQQEQFAEQGYRDSGYSHKWLLGQWGQTIGPCWTYA